MSPLIPESLLRKSDKILFVTHLAIGDFTYLSTFFEALARAYPKLAIDLLINDTRRSWLPWCNRGLANYSLYSWLEACPYLRRHYKTWSPALFKESFRLAGAEKYPIVISFGQILWLRHARWARALAPEGFVAGLVRPPRWNDFAGRRAFRRLDATLNMETSPADAHVTDIYALWFEQFFGVRVLDADRGPHLTVPASWRTDAAARFAAWGIDPSAGRPRVVFLNPFAKYRCRSWPLSRAAELIRELRKDPAERDTRFIMNVVPEQAERVRRFLDNEKLAGVHLFTAADHFFQLPAAIARCDLVITVETAVAHLASAVHVPVLVLMRQLNPEWKPWDKMNRCVVTTLRRPDWVSSISLDRVLSAYRTWNAPKMSRSHPPGDVEMVSAARS